MNAEFRSFAAMTSVCCALLTAGCAAGEDGETAPTHDEPTVDEPPRTDSAIR